MMNMAINISMCTLHQMKMVKKCKAKQKQSENGKDKKTKKEQMLVLLISGNYGRSMQKCKGIEILTPTNRQQVFNRMLSNLIRVLLPNGQIRKYAIRLCRLGNQIKIIPTMHYAGVQYWFFNQYGFNCCEVQTKYQQQIQIYQEKISIKIED